MNSRRGRSGGFTLIELIIVIVLIGTVSAYAFMRNGSASTYTVRSQAETLAANLRHTQALATTWNRRLIVSFSGGSYSVRCVNVNAPSPCNGSNPVTDPATGLPFVVAVVNVSVDWPAPLVFDSTGNPGLDSNSYTVSSDGWRVSVTVAALTGNLTVTSQTVTP